ncbi:hypothetical protein ACP4OV_025882 [Aristida adscensionis]
MVDTKSKKFIDFVLLVGTELLVLFTEAGKEFVDFVLSLLTLPIGAIVKLISAGRQHARQHRLPTQSVDHHIDASYCCPAGQQRQGGAAAVQGLVGMRTGGLLVWLAASAREWSTLTHLSAEWSTLATMQNGGLSASHSPFPHQPPTAKGTVRDSRESSSRKVFSLPKLLLPPVKSSKDA